jgi:hypothetical protein
MIANPSGSSAASVVRRFPAALLGRAAGVRGLPDGRTLGRGADAGTMSAGGTAGGILRRETLVTTSEHGTSGGTASETVRDSLTSREWDELVDEVVRRIEHRVADELARRGRRFTPPVM